MKDKGKPQSWLKERGQALAEFGLVAPVLFMLILGIIDLGRVVFVYSMSLNALREATRNAEILGYQEATLGLPNYLNCNKIENDASDIVFIEPADVTVSYKLFTPTGASSIKDCDTDPPSKSDIENGDLLIIDMTVDLDLLTPFANQWLGGGNRLTFDLNAQRTIIADLSLNPNDANDTDFDGLNDNWEIANFGSITVYNATDDPDGDGLNNGAEENNLTNPKNPDTDGDGLNDREEVYIYETNPLEPDTDGDTLNDFDEVRTWNTDPLNPDSDGDTLLDGHEVNGTNSCGFKSDPLKIDTDEDGLTDDQELIGCSDPGLTDTDGDGLSDTDEALVYLTDPTKADTDGDGLSDRQEVLIHTTNPLDPDHDDDGLLDGQEINTYNTDPKRRDTDGDKLFDGAEVNGTNTPGYPSDPSKWDSDADFLSDFDEVTAAHGYYSNPMDENTDDDCLNDYDEVITYGGQGYDPNIADPTCPGPATGPGINDVDGDGLPDEWEVQWFGSIDVWGADDDPDSDGASNIIEMRRGTNPLQGDSDNDGISDDNEIFTYGTDPHNPDTDGDGLLDGDEAYGTGQNFGFVSDPTKVDTDSDGLTDWEEVQAVHGYRTNPSRADTDLDGLMDRNEIFGVNACNYDSNPTLIDSDEDGLTDAEEIALCTDPMDRDSDDDGLDDGDEVHTYGTDPTNPDTDADGLGDGDEVLNYGTLPNDNDTDNDGLLDGAEVSTYKTNPLAADTDGDGLGDGDEVLNYTTDPTLPDTDGDGAIDSVEVVTYKTNPKLPDTDGDGLTDGAEINGPGGYQPSNPLNVNTDNDTIDSYCPAGGLTDGDEVNNYGTDPSKLDTDGDGLTDCQEIFDGDPNTDPTDAISISFEGPNNGDQTVTEPQRGNQTVNMIFTVTLSEPVPAGKQFTVDYQTVDFTAVAGSDYVANRGRLIFNPGDKTKTITVVIKGDNLKEGTETFSVSLYSAFGGRIDDSSATGTILDED